MYKCKYFKPDEFTRLSGSNQDIKEVIKISLDLAREFAGIPFEIISAHRTPEQNCKAGGVADSAHLSGEAVDIKNNYENKITTAKIIFGLTRAGFTRIGIAKTFIHADKDKIKPSAIWDYN